VEPDGRRLLFSYPNDAWLYLALQAIPATPFNLLVPGMHSPDNFATVLDALRRRTPGTVLLVVPTLDSPEGAAIRSAVEAGYDPVGEFSSYRAYVRRGPDGAR
jgi:hypothetical protein